MDPSVAGQAHPPKSSSPPPTPTRTRHLVIVFAITLAIIQYIDRVCISQAEPFISHDLGLSKSQMGWVFGVFTLAYAIFEIPTGYMGDRIGARRVLTRVVLWWSFFTAVTGWAWNWISLVMIRFLFGAGEAGCFPNLTKAFERWLPSNERVRAQAVMWMCARWGGAVTPYLVYLVIGVVHWRVAFYLFGLLGAAWAIVFFRWFRDEPRNHPSVNSSEAALIAASSSVQLDHDDVPWAKLIRSKSVWLLCGQYFACSYSWYFFITWFPKYLLEVRGFDLKKSAILAGLPLFLGGLGSMLAGALIPRLQLWLGGVARARRFTGVFSLTSAATCLVVSTFLQDPLPAVFAIAFASFCNDLSMPASWTSCMDIGGRYVGTVSGTMNMMGNFGGFVSPIVLGYVVEWTNNWNLTFYVTASLYLLGALCWLAINPVTPLDEQVRD